MPPPQTLAQAKTAFSAEKAKFAGALSALAGSRVLAAVLATFVIAFGVNLIYSPSNLPPLSGITLATVGLPPNLDFGVVGEQAREASDAAARQGGPDAFAAFLAEHRELVPILNGVGFALTLALLFGNMTIMTIRRRSTRG